MKTKFKLIALAFIIGLGCLISPIKVNAKMPFYNLKPKDLVVRAEFFTSYQNSTKERKHNIALATASINNTFVDVGGEFSFNNTVGKRTEKRGYKSAKIILNGEFIEGVGGGVCQVSTTLYNAVILAGLKVTEYHPHSLKVSYVLPSFDAMVNSNTADLRFVNTTNNPIIINATADGEKLLIKIIGEKSDYTIERVSVEKEEIPFLEDKIVIDEKLEYPTLYEGEKRYIVYPKKGLKSVGYLIKRKNGKVIEKIKLREDKYGAIRGVIVVGTAKREEVEEQFLEE